MSIVKRAVDGARTVATDPTGRRAYLARVKWLLNGSGTLPAHSIEYRAGLTGRFAIPAERLTTDDELVMHCPGDCGVHAPLSHLYERRSVYRLRQTVASTVSGATLMCGTDQPSFFVRESITWPFESILSHGLDVPEVRQASERFRGSNVVFPTTANYYHWLIEDLPAVLRATQVAPDATFLAFADGITDRHRLVAGELGLRLTPAPVVVAMDEQILPGRADGSWFVHPEDARLLADLGRRLTDHDGRSGTGRLYVSRRNSQRSLPHEAAVEQVLADRGFTVLHLESMPWTEQIRAFQNAHVVVAPHGAGLSNLIFTAPGAIVVEITAGEHYNRCFEWICHVRGHEYRKVDGDAFDHGLIDRLLAALP